MVRIVRWVLIVVVVLFAALYGADYAIAKIRVAKNASGSLESVKVQPLYIIPHKDSRAEYVFGDPQMKTCLHSIFPHFGYGPCWYVKRNLQPTVSMTIVPTTP
jgi:hypothetical protein